MRLPDFSFPSGTHPDILSRAAEFNGWIEKVSAENFIKAGLSGEEPVTLPGILDSIEASDALLVDEVDTKGASGSVKVISGWADSDLTITLLLIDIPKYDAGSYTPDITRFDCLAEIRQRFKAMKDGAPCIYTLQHPHIAAWGIGGFLFNDLKSVESRGKRIITCTLGFDEFDSTSRKSQDRQLGISMQAQAAPAKSVNPVVPDETRRGLGKLEASLGG
jgi:hypothetical protein